ncbi:MAG: hypothetical protein RR054_04945 [Clostridia bacterium]
MINKNTNYDDKVTKINKTIESKTDKSSKNKKAEKLAIRQAKIDKAAEIKAKKISYKKAKVENKIKNSTKTKNSKNETLSLKKQLELIAKKQNPDADWLHLDNAALIFPSAENADMSSMYRITVLMKDTVQPLLLQEALNETVPRFPSIVSAVKHGFFWYYLEPSNKPLVVEEQTDFPSRKIPLDARHSLIRVTYFKNEISVEYFHAASDGAGAVVYFNSLIACYIKLLGCEIKEMINCRDTRDKPRPEELTDSFQTAFNSKTKGSNNGIIAYTYKGRSLPATSVILVKGVMDGKQLLNLSRTKDCTITELLTAVLIWSFLEDIKLFGKKAKHPIIISVPVNLRSLYPSQSLRNFVSMMAIKHEGESELDDIILSVKNQMKQQYCKEFFDGLVGFNVQSQHNPAIKLMPLFIKNITLRVASYMYGDKMRTTTISNLGNMSAPPEFKDYVLRYEYSLGPQKRESLDMTCGTYNGTCVITVSKTIYESNIERFFFSKLADLGMEIAMETNFEL